MNSIKNFKCDIKKKIKNLTVHKAFHLLAVNFVVCYIAGDTQNI